MPPVSSAPPVPNAPMGLGGPTRGIGGPPPGMMAPSRGMPGIISTISFSSFAF